MVGITHSIMAEVVDIQTIEVYRKTSPEDKKGRWERNEPDISTIRLPPIHRGSETVPVNASRYTYKRSRKKITVSFVRQKGDVNANEIEEKNYVYETKDNIYDSEDFLEDSNTDHGEQIISVNNDQYSNEYYKDDCAEGNNAPQNEYQDHIEDYRTSKTSNCAIDYSGYTRDSTTALPFDCDSLEGI